MLPTLPFRARDLADKLFHILINLFKGQLRQERYHFSEEEFDTADELCMSVSLKVRDKLYHVFKKAWDLRLEMEKHPRDYVIELPAYREQYVADKMRVVGRQSSDKREKVSMCLLPGFVSYPAGEGSCDGSAHRTVIPSQVLLL